MASNLADRLFQIITMRISLFISALLLCSSLHAEYNSTTIKQYIDQWWQTAVEEMEEFGIPASISLAQGILESGAGTSRLATEGYNHFGIKCHSGWNGKRIYADDDAEQECFRKYRNAADSWRDHSDFLRGRDRYSALFFLQRDDYVGWAKGLRRAGYATNPKYANILIKLIDNHDLSRYDKMGREEITASTGRANSNSSEIEEDNRIALSGGVFWFNRIKTVYVQPGDNPTVIAKRHKIKKDWLLRYNDLNYTDVIKPGDKIYLQPKRKKGKQKFHLVKEGENLNYISQLHGVRLDALATRNLVEQEFKPAVGERIFLKKKRDNPPKAYIAPNPVIIQKKEAENARRKENLKLEDRVENTQLKNNTAKTSTNSSTLALPTPVKTESTTIFYTVEKGDTLYKLSQYFKQSVDQIKGWNGLEDNNISVGQQLIVGME